MDIEGQEVKVLESLLTILDKLKSVKILFEVHPQFYNLLLRVKMFYV